jgi:hypothetical protein
MNYRLKDGAMVLVRPSQPGVLPSYRYILEVPTVLDIGSVIIAELQRLVPRQRNRRGKSNAGIPLKSIRALHAVEASAPSKPVVSIERDPQPRLKIVADVSLKRTYWTL